MILLTKAWNSLKAMGVLGVLLHDFCDFIWQTKDKSSQNSRGCWISSWPSSEAERGLRVLLDVASGKMWENGGEGTKRKRILEKMSLDRLCTL